MSTEREALGCIRELIQFWLKSAVKITGAVSAGRAAHGQHDARHHRGERLRQDDPPDGLEMGGADAEGGLTEGLGNAQESLLPVRRMVGRIRIERATPPASEENLWVGRTTAAKAKTPQMIEGIPVSSLATKRTAEERRETGAYSLM